MKFYSYLLKEISSIFFLSLTAFTFILVLSRIRKFAELVLNRNIELKDIVLLLLYSLPPSLIFTLPMAFLLSTIVSLGRLSAENEILSLKTCGVDLKRIFIPVTTIALIVVIWGTINSYVFLPRSVDLFRETIVSIVKKGISIDEREGIFNDSIPGVVIYIERAEPSKGLIKGLLISDERDDNVRHLITAKTGTINFDTERMLLSFSLTDGILHRWEKGGDIYRNLSFKDYEFVIDLKTIMPKVRQVRKRPFEMDYSELKKSVDSERDPRKKYDIAVEAYKKLTIPLSPLSFIFLSVPLGIKRRGGRMAGLTLSLFLFLAYYFLMGLWDNVGWNLDLPPFLASLFPNILVALLGLALSTSINKDDRIILLRRLLSHEKAR